MSACTSRLLKSTLAFAMAGITFLAGLPASMAADHGDGPFVSVQRSGDLGDLYVFLDPNDNGRLVVALTTQGFIIPGEAVNFSVFDHELVFQLLFETTGDARPDRSVDVRFSRKAVAGSNPQIATIIRSKKLVIGSDPGLAPTNVKGRRFKAPTTVSNLSSTSSPAPVITTDPRTGIQFFAGEVDDPFFFDIPGFNRFVAAVLAGNPAAAQQLIRGRDTFAGYNTLAIVLSIPVGLLGNLASNEIGVNARSVRLTDDKQIDREGVPAVNVALIPFPRKDRYNLGTTAEDAAGKFAPSIIATLQALGTNQTGIDLLANLAVTKGDFLRLDTRIANTGPGGGNITGAGFPNGRRLGDDVIDTILAVVSNGAVTTGDSVNGNDKPLRDVFPFFGETQQPRVPGTIDDNTRN